MSCNGACRGADRTVRTMIGAESGSPHGDGCRRQRGAHRDPHFGSVQGERVMLQRHPFRLAGYRRR